MQGTDGRSQARAVQTDEPPVLFVDAHPFSWTYFAGIPRYTARLAMALAALVDVRFFTGDRQLLLPRGLSWSQDQDPERWARRIWRGRRIPLGPPPSNSIGLYCGLRPEHRTFPFEVGVLHDLCPMIVPETMPDRHRIAFEQYHARALPQSDLVLAVSHSSREDALWLSPLDPARIVVAPSGPSLCVVEHCDRRPVHRKGHVALVVSTIEPRKNAAFLIDWFHQTPTLPPGMELWWVGKRGWLTSRRDLRRLARRSGGRRVRFLGNVSDARLCRLYRTAACSIMPSLYEGFGFPVLDSLRHGTPVLASLNSALAEFAHEGVHFFDPGDAGTLDRAWQRLASAAPDVVELAALDQQYNWVHVAQTLLAAHARMTGARAQGTTLAA